MGDTKGMTCSKLIWSFGILWSIFQDGFQARWSTFRCGPEPLKLPSRPATSGDAKAEGGFSGARVVPCQPMAFGILW